MDEKKLPKEAYEVSLTGKDTQFKISLELDKQQFKRLVAFLMRK